MCEQMRRAELAEQRVRSLLVALREASEELDAAGCQVAASNAHQAVVDNVDER
jgi:hypothetical protein